MGEIQFSCPRCTQPLAAGEDIVGLVMPCPHCGEELQIPASGGVDGMDVGSESDLRGQIQALESALEEKNQATESANHELAKAKSILVETLQQLRFARNELEKLRIDGETAERSKAALVSRMQSAEETSGKLQDQLRSAEIQAQDTLQQLETVKTQRSAYLWETTRLETALLQANQQLSRLEATRKEMEAVLERAVTATESLKAECSSLQRELGLKTNDLTSALAELALAERAREEAESRREQVTNQLLASKDAASLNKAEACISELQKSLDRIMTENLQIRGRYEDAEQERIRLKEENLDLQLQLSATREVLGDSHLHQENELLRGVIERTNEQIRAMRHSSHGRRFIPLNEPFEPEENRGAPGLRWLQALLAKWGHSA